MKIKKILLYGIGSFKNRGCEALVNSTITQFPDDVEIIAATFDYNNNKNKYKNKITKYVNHRKTNEEEFTQEELKELKKIQSLPFDYNNYENFYEKEVIKELKNVDLAIHIGGDNYCYGDNEWLYAINNNAKKLNKKTILWGASLYDEITDLELIEDLKKYDLLILREKISYNAIKKYISEEKLMLAPDPAFSLEPKKVKLNKWYQNRNIVGINLSPLTIKNEESYLSIKEMIDYILNNTKYSIALIPHVTIDSSNDFDILSKLKEDYLGNSKVYLEEGNYDCQEIKYIISKFKLFIAARTHASIAAYSSCIPTLVIGYSVKSRGIAEDIFGNYKNYVIPTEEITKEKLISGFKFINENQEKIKNKLEKEIKKISVDAKSIYSIMFKKLEQIEKEKICSQKKCVGCTACMNICPKHAITMQKNSEGFLYPKIDLDKCIECGLCKKVCCRINESKNTNNVLECYAAKAKEKFIQEKSSSGGIFYYLAKKTIEEKGIVYGATLNDYKVSHIRITNTEEIAKLQGSKYAESDLSNNIYNNVKQDLEKNKLVLFSGTPCQILGLKSYLNKEYEKLYTVSVICHGVINDDILNKRIKEVEDIFESKMQSIKYKSKTNGWDISSIDYNLERINKTYKFSDDPMMNLFIDNYILRESCYDCPAKGKNNLADIILGDFWGIYDIDRNFFDHAGVSAIIINTEAGKKLFNSIKDNLNVRNVNIEDIAKYNPSLVKSATKPLERNVIFKELSKNTFQMVDKAYNKKKITAAMKEISNLKDQNNNINAQLQQIRNSKRYKFIDKIGNIKNKIFK